MVGPDHQALEAIQKHDVEVTALLGGNAKDIGLPIPPGRTRLVFTDDPKSIDSALNCLYRNGLETFDAVYAHDDTTVMTAAVLGQVLGARAIHPRTAALFRDKFLQKQVLAAAGIIVARSELIEDIRDLPAGWELPFAKAVVKPVAGQATQTTYAVTSTAEVRRISRECKAKAIPSRTFVVEEFVEGEEWFADGVVSDGRVRFVSLGRYAKNCLDAVAEHSPVRTLCLDPVTDKAFYDLAGPVVNQALATLGLGYGVFHMELFYDGARLAFSECAARRGGGPISDQVRHKFGVDLAALSVLSQLQPIGDIAVEPVEGSIGSAFLPTVEGTLLDHPSVADLLAQPDVINARIFVPKGLRAAPTGGNTFGRMGEFTVHTKSWEEMVRRLDEVSAWFAANTKVLPLTSTMRELRSLNLGG
ncbi:hypothetical protein Rhe02_48410 [Rhizocola hellebori]|uniref:ATP-grasp domain-containing protein n=1 Tax=Rhizocola hellebori TaxID=1392758 RepID=A0A8J3VGW5_9ACTN|nr:ATP-grasp domain-containing protein [Rhizocola hellebori]GIH06774.1 hypothetical protein Rhe02_48410 [Rhizocola hellebori]